MEPSVSNRVFILLATLAACVATYFPASTHLGETAARAFSSFVLAVVFWATELGPLPRAPRGALWTLLAMSASSACG